MRNVVIDTSKILFVFGSNVKQARKALKITQLQLAKRIGCHINAISSIETAKADPSLSTVIKISLALEVPISDLLNPKFVAINEIGHN